MPTARPLFTKAWYTIKAQQLISVSLICDKYAACYHLGALGSWEAGVGAESFCNYWVEEGENSAGTRLKKGCKRCSDSDPVHCSAHRSSKGSFCFLRGLMARK